MRKEKCFLCGQIKNVFSVGILLCMFGDHYLFCFDCLKKMSAYEFWKRFFRELDYAWPPKYAKPKHKWAYEEFSKSF